MTFRHDMQNKTPLQQMIVRKRDEEERALKREREKQKEREIQKQVEEYSQIEELLNQGYKYIGSIEHGGNLEIEFTNNELQTNIKINLKYKDNIKKAIEQFNILD